MSRWPVKGDDRFPIRPRRGPSRIAQGKTLGRRQRKYLRPGGALRTVWAGVLGGSDRSAAIEQVAGGLKMGQFDLETDAALTQLNFEELSKTPGGEFAEIISDLVALIGTGGFGAVTGGASSLLLKIRKLAGASYANNLVSPIAAVRNDLRTLYESRTELRERIESLSNDPKLAEAISALALRAMHTSVKSRLKRLARIVVNGVKENDLDPECLDDMTRAAVELSESDILLLGEIYAKQADGAKGQGSDRPERMSSITKLQAAAFVQLRTPGLDFGANIVILLPGGKKFYERLRELGTSK